MFYTQSRGKWVAMGDFNTIFDVDKRMYGNKANPTETEDGCKFLLEHGLGFVNSMVYFFSWTKRGETDRRMVSRIDYCIAYSSWLLEYDKALVTYKEPGISPLSYL